MTTRGFVPLNERGYRKPVQEWSKSDLMAMDAAHRVIKSRLARDEHDDEEKDPQRTNRVARDRGRPRPNSPGGFRRPSASGRRDTVVEERRRAT